MNKQGKLINGKVVEGIEWVKTILPDGTERQGYTWNPVAGCPHACRWTMPDGTVAKCYAESQAESYPAMNHYPYGFDHPYWHPKRLDEPGKVKESARIFLDSMSDLMAARVPEDQIKAVLQVARRCDWHTFQLLTKNSPRLAKFIYPVNVWVGVSSAPDQMFGRELDRNQQERYMHRALSILSDLRQSQALTTWVSFEPLSWDVAPIVAQYPQALRWAVVGAASNGNRYYQPDPRHVEGLLRVLDEQGCPTFFKGNLEWPIWREAFPSDAPAYAPAEMLVQGSLF